MMIILAGIMSLFFAMNIGASGAAASLGVAYGSGAIPSKRHALLLCGVAIFLGAFLGGSEVVKTIGEDLIPSSLLNAKIVLIILSSAAISLFIANLMGIPLSTSEITVGSVVGVGVAYKSLFIGHILWIVFFWIFIPFVSFGIALAAGKLIMRAERKYTWLKASKSQRYLSVFVIVVGFFEAFSAGMNNVANAVGPMVGANLISMSSGILIGGLAISIGAILLGGRVLQTNGKKIVQFSKLEGGIISGIGATLVTIASIFGLPVPLTQVTSTAIIGIGVAKNGVGLFKKQMIHRIIKVWIVSPVLSLVISYCLVQLFVKNDFYNVIVLSSVCIATLGILSLVKSIKEDNRSIYEDGGGI
ncbi:MULTISPECIES: inorganic phosphate transporter [Bacillaceae]|uniref:inorganic phosphate transporter n=2 Tax=Bacillales TaxID=1385 RepID=UPI0037C76419